MRTRSLPASALLPLLLAMPVLCAPAALAPGSLTYASAQVLACAVPSAAQPPGETPAELHELRRFATGAGVRVAVIDTGVAPHPELNHLRPGADFVGDNALADCDSHGTVVAGVIAGRTLGIAPDAEILAVRQTSAHYRGGRGQSVAGDLETLASAINNALDEGARVLNVSVVSCVDPGLASRIDLNGLRGALHRAEADGAVVVAASGNTSADCEPGFSVIPALFPTVLAVGAREDTHTLASYSMPAEISAAGLVPHALASSGNGWADGTLTRDGSRPYVGTSFAAPVVSGAAALLMQRYPGITPDHVRTLITAAAQHGGGAITPHNVISQLTPDDIAPRDTVTVAPTERTASLAAKRFSSVGLGAVVFALLGALALCAASTWRSKPQPGSAPRPPARG